MVCHVCGKAAIGQGTRCWKFYCADHGDQICSVCGEKARQGQEASDRISKAFFESQGGFWGKRAMRTKSGLLRSVFGRLALSKFRNMAETEDGAILTLGEFGDSSEESEERLAQRQRFQMNARELKRVVPIAQSTAWGEKQLTLISLEAYEDGSTLRYQINGADEPMFSGELDWSTWQISTHPNFRAEDDAGSNYFVFFGGGGSGGTNGAWRGEVRMTPELSQSASTVSFFVRQPLGASATDSGSATRFDIAL
jgi:hypothetical protein